MATPDLMAMDVGLTAVYFLPLTNALPLSFTALLTHLGLRSTQANVWQGQNCYLDLSQQEGFSQVRLTVFTGEAAHVQQWNQQWQKLIHHHQQITCVGSTLVYWALGEVGWEVMDWRPFVPARHTFPEPVLVPRPSPAVYLCHQSLGHRVYVALTSQEQTVQRQIIYNPDFWQLEQWWHLSEQAKHNWLSQIDPPLLDYLIQVEQAIDDTLAAGSRENRQRLTAVYQQFIGQLHRVTQAERLVRQQQSHYKKKLWQWTTAPPLPLLPEMGSPVSAGSLINLHQQVTLCQQVRYHWWQATIDKLKTSWRKRWKTMTIPLLSIN